MVTQNWYQDCLESVVRDLIAAARQMDETMVSAFTAVCSFQRLDLALVNPGKVQTILVNDVTAAGSTAEEWSDGDLTTVRGAKKEDTQPQGTCRDGQPSVFQSMAQKQSQDNQS